MVNQKNILCFLGGILMIFVLVFVFSGCAQNETEADGYNESDSGSEDEDFGNITGNSSTFATLKKIHFILNPVTISDDTSYYYPIRQLLDIQFRLDNVRWGYANTNESFDFIDSIPTVTVDGQKFLTINPHYYIELTVPLEPVAKDTPISNYYSRISGNIEAGDHSYQLQTITYLDIDGVERTLNLFHVKNITLTSQKESYDLGHINYTNQP